MKRYWFMLVFIGLCLSPGTAIASGNALPTDCAAVIKYFRQLYSLTYAVNCNEIYEQGFLSHDPDWGKDVWLNKINQATYNMHKYVLLAHSMNVPPVCSRAQTLLLEALGTQDRRFQDQYRLLRWKYRDSRKHLTPQQMKRLDYEGPNLTPQQSDDDYHKTFGLSDQLSKELDALRVKFGLPEARAGRDYNQLEIFL